MAIALLHLASVETNPFLIFLAAYFFSLIGNTIFSLLHEAVHGIFHTNKTINLWFGRALSFWFPTSFTIQRSFHLTHHANNRNQFEQFDVIHDGDVLWLKYAQWYSILTGIYWWVTQLALILYLIIPNPALRRIANLASRQGSIQTGGHIYVNSLLECPPVASRLELLSAFYFQFSIVHFFDISLMAWTVCYAAFALQWSSLQYTDHAFSPLDIKSGAWNLKINALIGVWFLNYHYHKSHHEFPTIPWIHLPSITDPRQQRPSFVKVWWSALQGPRKLDEFPHF